MIDVIHGEQSNEKIGAKQPLHVSSSHGSMSEGSPFESAEMKGILVRFRRSGLPFLSSSY
jgi:hypothetical protein